MQRDFFDASFGGDHELRVFLGGPVSARTIELVSRRLNTLAAEFTELQRDDAMLPVAQRETVGLVLGFRRWEFPAFAELRRDSPRR